MVSGRGPYILFAVLIKLVANRMLFWKCRTRVILYRVIYSATKVFTASNLEMMHEDMYNSCHTFGLSLNT